MMTTLLLLLVAVALALYAAYELWPAGARPLWRRRSALGTTSPGPSSEPPRPAASLGPASMPVPLPVPGGWRVVAALLPLWVVMALWETDPLYKNMTSLPAGMDTTQFVWNLWWMKYALVDLHQNPFYTSYLFAPQQANLAFHVFTALNGVVSVPLQLLFGLNVAFNLVLLGGFVASSLGAYLLVRQETGSIAGAVVGSSAFPYAPYVMNHLNGGHFPVVNTWAVPFFALFLLRWLRVGRLQDAALAGLMLSCVGYNDLDQITFCAVFGILAVVGGLGWRMWSSRRTWTGSAAPATPPVSPAALGIVAGASGTLPRRPKVLRVSGLLPARLWLVGLIVLSAVSVITYLPELVPYVDGLRHGWATTTPLDASDGAAPDLVAFVTPLWLHPVWGQWAGGIAASLHFHDWPRIVFVGYTKLGLALLAMLSVARRRVLYWWGITLFFFVLTLGPHLKVLDHEFNIPLPYILFHATPLIGGGRIPGYGSVMISLGLTVLAGFGTAALITRVARLVRVGSWNRYVAASVPLTIVFAFCILFESLTTPLPLFTPPVSPVYAALAREPGHQAVLEEPLGWQDGRIMYGSQDGADLYTATVSHKPLVSGYLGRVADRLFAYYEQQPALTYLVFPDHPGPPQSQDATLVRATLRHMGVGYIIVHRYVANYDNLVGYVRRIVGATPIYADSQLTAYQLH